MPEKDITAAIQRYLRTLPACFFWKEHGGPYGQNGIPDLIVCYHGRFVALEVKGPEGKLSALQSVTIRKIINAGGVAAEVRSVNDVRKILHGLEAETRDQQGVVATVLAQPGDCGAAATAG
jgi:hypothetical protein